jgi:hypothetical protein
MSALGGLMGLALGYYVLLWLGIDLLGAARYLPQAMLPASLKPSQKVAATPAPPLSATQESAATPANENPSSEEKVAEDNSAAPTPDQSATSKADTAVEPAAFNEPGAVPEISTEPAPVRIEITGAPSFTTDELAASYRAGNEAEPNLVNGNLSDNRETARRKGFSYSILADLAQKLTFVAPDSAESKALRTNGLALFSRILSDTHARDEIAQIVPKWIASPNRKQGGVFFAANVVSNQPQGTVNECNVEFGGQALPVLLPATAANQPKASAAPVAVVGWIVSEPAKTVPGYTGAAPQAVFANELLPIE